MMVTADGAVKPCCFAPGQLGNLHDATADEVWNGPAAVELRRFIKANRVHPICDGAPCKFVENMRGKAAADAGGDVSG
jgi:MoaA/NifB/PqqE/SkfB family radical SAM enzyme